MKGYFEEAPNYVCSTPDFFSQLGSNDGIYNQNNFKITVSTNVVDANAEYLYSCNWKTETGFQKRNRTDK